MSIVVVDKTLGTNLGPYIREVRYAFVGFPINVTKLGPFIAGWPCMHVLVRET